MKTKNAKGEKNMKTVPVRFPQEIEKKTKVADRFQNIAIISVIPNMVKAGYRG